MFFHLFFKNCLLFFILCISDTSRARREGEIDGQDYHFITRSQFEADILSRKFVEHGEYEKAYYGKEILSNHTFLNSKFLVCVNERTACLDCGRSAKLDGKRRKRTYTCSKVQLVRTGTLHAAECR